MYPQQQQVYGYGAPPPQYPGVPPNPNPPYAQQYPPNVQVYYPPQPAGAYYPPPQPAGAYNHPPQPTPAAVYYPPQPAGAYNPPQQPPPPPVAQAPGFSVNFSFEKGLTVSTGSPVSSRTSTCPRCNGKGFYHDSIHKCISGGAHKCMFCTQCVGCNGRGSIDGNVETCRRCNGQGKYHESIHHHGPGCIFCTKCQECSQKGFIISGNQSSSYYPVVTPQPQGEQFLGHCMISNALTRMAIDGNVGGANQKASSHPKPFMWVATPSAKNHQWSIQHVEGEFYNIVLRDTNKCLDGNTNVPQTDPRNPAPFLWQKQSHAPNHQWRVQRVGVDEFMLINRQNNLALDGNTGTAMQYDANHPTPFLAAPTPSSASQRWVIRRIV